VIVDENRRNRSVAVFCGIDWAEDHHDIALVDQDGALLAKRRIDDDAAGFTALLQLLADAGDQPDGPIPVAIEISHGLLVAGLRATGRPVYPINPMSVSRYRDRHSVARRKSDAGDAFVLANILRTDRSAHRPLPADSELAQAIAVLARAQQDAVWARTDAHNKLRSLLHEFYPALLAAFATKRGGLLRREARALLAAAPTPQKAARLTLSQLRAVLRRAGSTGSGRSRGETAAIREWANANGLEVSTRGRISSTVLEAYENRATLPVVAPVTQPVEVAVEAQPKPKRRTRKKADADA
jgi:hypothetical protein